MSNQTRTRPSGQTGYMPALSVRSRADAIGQGGQVSARSYRALASLTGYSRSLTKDTAAPPQTTAQAPYGGPAALPDAARGTDRRTPHALDSAVVGAAAVDGADLVAEAEAIFGDDVAFVGPAVPWNSAVLVAKPGADA